MSFIKFLGLFKMLDAFDDFQSGAGVLRYPMSYMARSGFEYFLNPFLDKPQSIVPVPLRLSFSALSHINNYTVYLYNILLNKITNKRGVRA